MQFRIDIFQEWVRKQEALKQEPIEITYRYQNVLDQNFDVWF